MSRPALEICLEIWGLESSLFCCLWLPDEDVLSLWGPQFPMYSVVVATLPSSPSQGLTSLLANTIILLLIRKSSVISSLDALPHESHVFLLQSLPMMAKEGFTRIRNKMSYRGINILFTYGPSFLLQTVFFCSEHASQIPLGWGCGT